MSPYFRHNAGNPLPYDLIVIDEASMVDLPLLSKLVQAMLPKSRLIFWATKINWPLLKPGLSSATSAEARP